MLLREYMKKKIVICAILLMFFIISVFIFRYMPNILEYPHIPKDKIIETYKNNKSTFYEISNFLNGIPEDVTIDKYKNNKYLISKIEESKILKIKITNKKIDNYVLFLLYNLKFKNIVEQGNGVYFLKQTDIGFEQGLVFSKDGNEPNWPLITESIPINNNWYYYESK